MKQIRFSNLNLVAVRSGDVHTNTIENAFSLFKRGIMGPWRHISAKHLASYLEEMEFRFNRRKYKNLFLDALRHMVTTPTLTYEKRDLSSFF
jgi:hypothetical protein